METWLWLTSIAALIGVWLNIRRHVACFYIWTYTNSVWLFVDLAHEIYAQAALQLAYVFLSFVGIWEWSQNRGQDRR